jgi:DNA-binding transcriptional MerR regulator
MSDEAVHKIGEVAESTGLSIRTLRHYDDLGLVVPSGHTAGGFRLYTEDDVERLLLVRRMKPLGFSLERMRQFLDAIDILRAAKRTGTSELSVWHEAKTTVEAVRAEARERYADLKKQLDYGAEFLQLVERAGD